MVGDWDDFISVGSVYWATIIWTTGSDGLNRIKDTKFEITVSAGARTIKYEKEK